MNTMTPGEFARLCILSTMLGMLISYTIYIKFLHPWMDSIGACQCHAD